MNFGRELTLKIHDDDMGYTKYAVWWHETKILVLTARSGLSLYIPGAVDYMESFLLPQRGGFPLNTTEDIRALPTSVRKIVNDLFLRFMETAQFKYDQQGTNPAIEAILKY